MQKIIFFTVITLFVFSFVSCDDDTAGLVNEEGLTQEIVNLVPDSILTEIKSLGMPIYGGENPPNIEYAYIVSPFVLKASNIESDEAGHTYNDYYVKFYNQDNSKLTTSCDYKNYPESGTGLGGYVVGDDNKFSVFVEVNAETEDGGKAKIVMILSGEWTSEGVNNMYVANFMLDNYGNETGYWINNGEGRVIYDSDGFSPITDSFKQFEMPINLGLSGK